MLVEAFLGIVERLIFKPRNNIVDIGIYQEILAGNTPCNLCSGEYLALE